MISPAGIDGDKLKALKSNPAAADGYRTWLDQFVIPLLKKVGLNVKVRRNASSYIITVKLPTGSA